MKICILTLPLHTNYGGILQAYALQTIMERMGHKVDVLQKIPKPGHPAYLMPVVYIKRLLKKLFFNWKSAIFLESKLSKEKEIIETNTRDFINKNLNLKRVKSLKDISPTDYDAIVVGSDQIWRKPYFCNMWQSPITDAFLGFTKDWKIMRISYAASFGVDNLTEYTPKEIEQCKEAIQQFNIVSVREYSGIDICKNQFRINACYTVDPTLLLEKEEYEALVKCMQSYKSPGNLLCYILDHTFQKKIIIDHIALKKGLRPFLVNSKVDDLSLPACDRIQPPLEQWLRGFIETDFVVTDSFHACIFSIIFNKPFIVIGNMKRGMSRIISLLSTFGLENRLVTTIEELNILSEIDWDSVNNKVQFFRKESNKYLVKSLVQI